jgi:hypothetical protein
MLVFDHQRPFLDIGQASSRKEFPEMALSGPGEIGFVDHVGIKPSCNLPERV